MNKCMLKIVSKHTTIEQQCEDGAEAMAKVIELRNNGIQVVSYEMVPLSEPAIVDPPTAS